MKKLMILTVIALAAIGCCKKDGKCCDKAQAEEAAPVAEEVVVVEQAADSTVEVVEVVEVAE